ncbi:MAG: hypothetical protein HZC55_21090 [Verrucomicrobia bacterium]|nr:hypothetical protein [Verrucomicrobiota bacterium]
MKTPILVFLLSLAAAVAAEPVVTVDLYGNVYLNGENTSQQIGDFARNNPQLAPQVDGAVRDTALAARKRIADEIKTAQDAAAVLVAAKEAEKQAAVLAAQKASADAIAANAADLADKEAQLATKATRVAALEAHLAALGTYIAGLRGKIAGLGGTSEPPPALSQ